MLASHNTVMKRNRIAFVSLDQHIYRYNVGIIYRLSIQSELTVKNNYYFGMGRANLIHVKITFLMPRDGIGKK
jgi:hypothetical protein